MLSRAKKIILTFLLSVFLITTHSVPFVHAQEERPWYNPEFFGRDGFYARVTDPDQPTEIFGERYTYAQVTWVIYGLFSYVLSNIIPSRLAHCVIIAEGDPLGIATCLGVELIHGDNQSPTPLAESPPQSGVKTFVNTITSNPISSAAYLQDLKTRLKLVPEAQAQGFGFTAANPVLELWRLVRNITYFFMVIVVIAMAFMIMFRTKISPQTVITVQSALPKVVFALILITFSYAIAGFMIDLMYVVIGLLAGIVHGARFTDGITWGQTFNQLTGAYGAVDLMGGYSILFLPSLMSSMFQGGIGLAILGGTMIIPMIITIVVGIVIIVLTIKILWMLIKTYVNILFQIILGPIQILLAVFSGGGFGGWLKTLIANLAVYPITGFLFVLAFIFLRSAAGDDLSYTIANWLTSIVSHIPSVIEEFPFGLEEGALEPGRGWGPPMTIGNRAIELMWLGASLVTLTMIPKAVDISKKFILGGRFEMSSAIGEGLAPMAAAYAWGKGQIGTGIQNELGYRAASWGQKLQESKSPIAQGLGRSLVSYGAPRAQLLTDKNTGVITDVLRKGTTGKAAKKGTIPTD